MCDCYGHKCELCDTIVPMHIGDFAFPRERFKVWCRHHVNKAPAGAVVFTRKRSLWKCAILGPDVGGDGNNYPNANYDKEGKR